MGRTSRRRYDKAELTFAPISHFAPGALADILRRSYAGLVAEDPAHWGQEDQSWEDFDRQAFAHPHTIGSCVFVSRLEKEQVGLASFDPRPRPRHELIGQNCILPEFRSRGFGKEQIFEVLRRFRRWGIGTALVATSAHPFFLPARRMYESLGFREIRRFPGGPDPRYGIIELVRTLDPARG